MQYIVTEAQRELLLVLLNDSRARLSECAATLTGTGVPLDVLSKILNTCDRLAAARDSIQSAPQKLNQPNYVWDVIDRAGDRTVPGVLVYTVPDDDPNVWLAWWEVNDSEECSENYAGSTEKAAYDAAVADFWSWWDKERASDQQGGEDAADLTTLERESESD